jgi:hypothetical protein
MADCDKKNARDAAEDLCKNSEQLKLVLTAIVTAVEERLGEDVILFPRDNGGLISRASVYNVKFNWKNQEIWQHMVFYEVPENPRPNVRELLRVTLDVAHELGHLLIDRGPGRLASRVGISKNEMNDVREVEADWFALCILQIYGFILPPDKT